MIHLFHGNGLSRFLWSLSAVSYYLPFSFQKSQREKRNHLRRTGASYQADEETLKRLILLDGSKPPPPKPDAVANSDSIEGSSSKEHSDKHAKLSHCLLPGCALRRGTGASILKSNTVLQMVSCWKRIKKCMVVITSHSTFDAVIVVLILLNTVVLALYHHGINPDFRHVLDYVNLVSDVSSLPQLPSLPGI